VKIFTLGFFLFFLTSCNDTIYKQVLPLEISPIQINLETKLIINHRNHDLTLEEIQQLLPDINFEKPKTTFTIKLFDENEIIAYSQITTSNPVAYLNFDDFYFSELGEYSFNVIQKDFHCLSWIIDDELITVDVTLTQNEETGLIETTTHKSKTVFNNTFVLNIEDELSQAIENKNLQQKREEMAQLEEKFLNFGDYTSFYFYNLESGFSHSFNCQQNYRGVSVGKVFFAHFLYIQEENGHIELTERDRMLIEYSLRTSLDVKSHELHNRFGLEEYNLWLESLGADSLINPYHHFGRTTGLVASEAVELLRNINNYLNSGSSNAEEFRYHMTNNLVPFIISDNYEVASKTGWVYVWNIIHDVAIVYAPSPYILIILTENDQIVQNHRYHFAHFSQWFEEFNDRWFASN